jgi:hypothetical protein
LAAKSSAVASVWTTEHQGIFDHENHAKNAYKKLKGEREPKSAKEMAAWWRADVTRRYAEKVAGAGN